MAKHDDLDLVQLFGLSADEANGLGLDQANEAADAAATESAARSTSSPGDSVRQTEEEMIAMLDRPSSAGPEDYNGHGAPRGLSLADTIAGAPTPSTWPEDLSGGATGSFLSVMADGQEPAGSTAPHANSADEIDVTSLFGLSSDEALGLGLTPLADAVERPDDAGPDEEADERHRWTDAQDDEGSGGVDVGTASWATAASSGPTATEPVAELPIALAGGDGQSVDPALLDAFAEESAELLDSLHVELENLEQAPDDRDALLEIRRSIHTIKGGAKMCGFEHVVTLTHACENLLDLIAEGTASLDTPALRALFACEPMLREAVQDALAGRSGDIDGLTRLAAHFDALCSAAGGAAADTASPSGEATSADDARESPSSAAGGLAPAGLASPGLVPTGFVPAPAVADAQTTPHAGRRGINSINVDLAKVDAVVAKVTEMAAHRVSYQAMVGQLMETAEEARHNVGRLRTLITQLANECLAMQDEAAARTDMTNDDLDLESYNPLNVLMLQVQEAVSDQQALVQRVHDTITVHWRLRSMENRVDADIQNALMNIRLIPISAMRVRLDGVVRQAAQATGKSVHWQLQGGNVAMEKNVFDRLFEPLMHLLRNAIDHGLEAPEARRAAGKPETGTITVLARQEDNRIVISVSDDGAGIIPHRIASIAVARGIIAPEQVATLSDQQKIGLIFTPGFSTAQSVSHLSGRGVGMDAVREAAARMGGTIDVESQQGVGTTFTLCLPLSLSVTRGLIVRDGGCIMALPVTQISALHLVPISDIVDTDEGRVARVEGQDLPIYNLPPLPGAAPTAYVQNGEIHVLQVQHDGEAIGVVIEDVLDEEEILIKAPPALLRPVKTLLGAYVRPDGTVAPVVNLPQILTDLRPVAALDPAGKEGQDRELTALVVDDSMSMRVALSGTLQSAGFKVMTARDGQEALDVLKREGLPRLVTLDIEMPRMDGLETLYAIRHIPGAQDLPVFIMTSRGGSKHRRAAEQLGATRYFTKPYRDSELAAAAREVCA